jgi:galactonate dehydratase
VRIASIEPTIVGNEWKNWVFVRVETDEGLVGLGEATVLGFARTVATAVEELAPVVEGRSPFDIEPLLQAMTRDLYADGGQIQMAAASAIEIACWDIMGKALGKPVYELLGGKVREKIRVYANGWYRVERRPEAFAAAALHTVARGYTALKFDPFGAAHLVMSRNEEDLAVAIVEAVRDAVGWDVDLMVEAHCRFSPATALRVAERLSDSRPAWLEEPVAHHNIGATVEVARRSPVPIATGESLVSLPQFAEVLGPNVVSIAQPEPLHVGGFSGTRSVAAIARAHYAVVAPHNAQGPICSAVSYHLGAALPNFLILESFDEFNADWTTTLVDKSFVQQNGYVHVGDDPPGLGIEIDWTTARSHGYDHANFLPLFAEGWERREPQTSRRR